MATSLPILRLQRRKRIDITRHVDLPFPDGPPVRGIHYAFEQWCYQNETAQKMGAADNIAVFILLKGKQSKINHYNHITPGEFPVKSALTLPVKAQQALPGLIMELDPISVLMQAETYKAKLEAIITSLAAPRQTRLCELLKSDEFERYALPLPYGQSLITPDLSFDI